MVRKINNARQVDLINLETAINATATVYRGTDETIAGIDNGCIYGNGITFCDGTYYIVFERTESLKIEDGAIQTLIEGLPEV